MPWPRRAYAPREIPQPHLRCSGNAPPNIRFILSSLKLIDQQVREIHGKINNKQIGVSGHSMGAGTALLVGGATVAPPNRSAQSFRDKHVHAVIAISPQGAGEEGFSDDSWDHIAVPTRTM